MFGDAVDDAAGAAAAEDHAAGTLEGFEALDVVEIAVVLDVVAEAIDEVVAGGAVAAEDDRVAVALALGGADTRDVADGVADAGDGDVIEQTPGEDADGLRGVDERGVGAGGDDGALDLIGTGGDALHLDGVEDDGLVGGRSRGLGEAGRGQGEEGTEQGDAGNRVKVVHGGF